MEDVHGVRIIFEGQGRRARHPDAAHDVRPRADPGGDRRRGFGVGPGDTHGNRATVRATGRGARVRGHLGFDGHVHSDRDVRVVTHPGLHGRRNVRLRVRARAGQNAAGHRKRVGNRFMRRVGADGEILCDRDVTQHPGLDRAVRLGVRDAGADRGHAAGDALGLRVRVILREGLYGDVSTGAQREVRANVGIESRGDFRVRVPAVGADEVPAGRRGFRLRIPARQPRSVQVIIVQRLDLDVATGLNGARSAEVGIEVRLGGGVGEGDPHGYRAGRDPVAVGVGVGIGLCGDREVAVNADGCTVDMGVNRWRGGGVGLGAGPGQDSAGHGESVRIGQIDRAGLDREVPAVVYVRIHDRDRRTIGLGLGLTRAGREDPARDAVRLDFGLVAGQGPHDDVGPGREGGRTVDVGPQVGVRFGEGIGAVPADEVAAGGLGVGLRALIDAGAVTVAIVPGLDGDAATGRDRSALDLGIEVRVHLRFREGDADADGARADAGRVGIRVPFGEGGDRDGAGHGDMVRAEVGLDGRGGGRVRIRARASEYPAGHGEGVGIRIHVNRGLDGKVIPVRDRPVDVGFNRAVGGCVRNARTDRGHAAGDAVGLGLGKIRGERLDGDMASRGQRNIRAHVGQHVRSHVSGGPAAVAADQAPARRGGVRLGLQLGESAAVQIIVPEGLDLNRPAGIHVAGAGDVRVQVRLGLRVAKGNSNGNTTRTDAVPFRVGVRRGLRADVDVPVHVDDHPVHGSAYRRRGRGVRVRTRAGDDSTGHGESVRVRIGVEARQHVHVTPVGHVRVQVGKGFAVGLALGGASAHRRDATGHPVALRFRVVVGQGLDGNVGAGVQRGGAVHIGVQGRGGFRVGIRALAANQLPARSEGIGVGALVDGRAVAVPVVPGLDHDAAAGRHGPAGDEGVKVRIHPGIRLGDSDAQAAGGDPGRMRVRVAFGDGLDGNGAAHGDIVGPQVRLDGRGGRGVRVGTRAGDDAARDREGVRIRVHVNRGHDEQVIPVRDRPIHGSLDRAACGRVRDAASHRGRSAGDAVGVRLGEIGGECVNQDVPARGQRHVRAHGGQQVGGSVRVGVATIRADQIAARSRGFGPGLQARKCLSLQGVVPQGLDLDRATGVHGTGSADIGVQVRLRDRVANGFTDGHAARGHAMSLGIGVCQGLRPDEEIPVDIHVRAVEVSRDRGRDRGVRVRTGAGDDAAGDRKGVGVCVVVGTGQHVQVLAIRHVRLHVSSQGTVGLGIGEGRADGHTAAGNGFGIGRGAVVRQRPDGDIAAGAERTGSTDAGGQSRRGLREAVRAGAADERAAGGRGFRVGPMVNG